MVESIDQGELIFVEEKPWKILGTNLAEAWQLETLYWGLRAVWIVGTVFLGYLILVTGLKEEGDLLFAVVLVLAIALTIFIAEINSRVDRRSARPVRIYRNGIELHVFLYKRLFGKRGYVPKENIDHLEILRYPIAQNLETGQSIVWKEAPIEIVVHTKDERRLPTGPKLPAEIMKIADILHEKWGVPVDDKGKGAGKAELMK